MVGDKYEFVITKIEGVHGFLIDCDEHQRLIRCKDCRYWKSEKERDSQPSWLPCMAVETRKDFYCADGKQRDE